MAALAIDVGSVFHRLALRAAVFLLGFHAAGTIRVGTTIRLISHDGSLGASVVLYSRRVGNSSAIPEEPERQPKPSGEADEAASGDDGEPEEEGEAGGQLCAKRRVVAFVPYRKIAKTKELEEEGLNACKSNKQEFQAKSGIVVEFDRFGGKKQKSGDNLNGERRPGPREEAMREIGETSSTKGQAQEAKIKGADGGDERSHAKQVNGFNRGKQPERFADTRSDVGLLDPLTEGERVEGGYGAPRSERPSGRMILPRDM